MRRYFRTKHEADEYGGSLFKLEKENSKLIKNLDPRLMESAVRFNELFQIYGFKGLADACESFVARLDHEEKSVSFGELLDSYEKTNQANWGHRHCQVWNTVRTLLKENEASSISILDKPFWKDWMESQEKKRNWSGRSYNDFLGRLSSIWKHAVDHDFLEKNPLDGIPRRKLKTARFNDCFQARNWISIAQRDL